MVEGQFANPDCGEIFMFPAILGMICCPKCHGDKAIVGDQVYVASELAECQKSGGSNA